MKYDEVQQWLRKKRDMIIVGLIMFAVLISIVIGMRMQKNYSARQQTEEQDRNPVKVRLVSSEQISGGDGNTGKKAPASFFLKPSPDEVLSLINQIGAAELPPANQEYTGLRVMWPVYFFQILQQQADRAMVLFDVSEDGFGVTIETEIDTLLFPEILTAEAGTKVWVAGEIKGVDAAGTGTIHMLTEEIRFQDDLMEAIKVASEQEKAEPELSIKPGLPSEEVTTAGGGK